MCVIFISNYSASLVQGENESCVKNFNKDISVSILYYKIILFCHLNNLQLTNELLISPQYPSLS